MYLFIKKIYIHKKQKVGNMVTDNSRAGMKDGLDLIGMDVSYLWLLQQVATNLVA